MSDEGSIRWRTPEQLVEIGFDRSLVVLMNEAHNGWLRCARTREVGTRILPVAHGAGVRHLAMEALADRELVRDANESRTLPEVRSPSYLAQPEMRVFIQSALDLGWTLIGYEADMGLAPQAWNPMSDEFTNWREEQQALNLVRTLQTLTPDARLLVWCGNGHLYKQPVPRDGWTWVPMGSRFKEISGIDPFAIDQIQSVEFGHPAPKSEARFLHDHAEALRSLGGTAGFLADDAPDPRARDDVNAVLLSLENRME